jgi:D-alanyl-D-alanine carboxypeptidase (penicillin-binding protein 5/6)
MVITRRARALSVLTILAVLSLAVAWWAGQPGWGKPASPSPLHSMTIHWSSQGESAITVIGAGRRASHPDSQRLPIASVAKVMTAYVVLQHFPLDDGQPGFTLTFSESDVQQAATDAADDQSYVPVAAGEQLTEREGLEALLLPSANNIAMALADRVAGSVPAFVQLMNTEAASLGMRNTTYTDPSGLALTTVSTAVDQLRLARVALRDPTLSQIVAMRQAEIPIVGTVRNTDTLLGRDGFVGGKTGSDSAAGGCFMFRAERVAHGRPRTVLGVVLGQRDGPLIQAALNAADDLVNSVVTRIR